MNTQTETRPNLTPSRLKEIKAELAKLKPVKVTLDGNRNMTVKEAIFALAPTLERMKKRGFDTQEIAEKLHEKGIEVKPPTLAKYLNEFRRGRDRNKDTPLPVQTEKAMLPRPIADTPKTIQEAGFSTTPNTNSI